MLMLFGLICASCLLHFGNSASVCCGDVGCFSDDAPWGHLPVPNCPSSFNPELRLYTRNNRFNHELVTRAFTGGNFNSGRRTHIVIHGWRGSGDNEWLISAKNALLDKGDFNVIVIDWSKGAEGVLDYWQAAANTRAVAAEVATVMMTSLQGLSWGNVYCIGHSLGAHTCGLVGKRASGLGRITGLDPAGPWWEDSGCEARLCQTDAAFVDNIHTDGDCSGVSVCYGIGQNIGDVDFYPNGGNSQPGCFRRKYTDGNGTEVYGDFGCSHSLAHAYFIESVQSSCSFSATYCPNKADQDAGWCESCGSDCQWMGYRAEDRPGRGRHYLTTNARAPFCKK